MLQAHGLFGRGKDGYWQQRADYSMDLRLDVMTNRLTGRQVVEYTNNSPDILDKVYFHLYLNAFKPGSEMDIRSRTIADPDMRVQDRISKLGPQELGYMDVRTLTQDGKPVSYEAVGTILEVRLAKPVAPGKKTRFALSFEAQVPVQIRRNGRDNREGIRYSMAQAYPKLCMYDRMGWHANPYIGREFYGNWGDFDVRITLDKAYVVAASGVLRNARAIGHGYAPEPASKPSELTWHFLASNVHDFMWAADPDFIHKTHTCRNGVVLHTFYQPSDQYAANWEALPAIMEEALDYANAHYGRYPYPVYSFVQGGDGGMEYPMGTLITGNRSLPSLVGVAVHEMMHSWYQGVLGFNESLYHWMDEGFTQYASEHITEYLKSKALLPGDPDPNAFAQFYEGYAWLVEKDIEEPMGTHADFFNYNGAYSQAAYNKGAVFLHQLQYVIGKPAFDRGMLAFFDKWKFRHPDDVDFMRVMEEVSGLELEWYRELMTGTTKHVDYAVDSVFGDEVHTSIRLRRDGDFPMPVDVAVDFADGRTQWYTIPLDIMRGHKTEPSPDGHPPHVLPDWTWVNPGYVMVIDAPASLVRGVRIDPSGRLADLWPEENTWPVTPKAIRE